MPQGSPFSALAGELGTLDRPGGGISTELSITVEDDRLNGGRPTNIPLLVGGQTGVDALLQNARPTKEQVGIAISRAAERVAGGANLPAFASIGDAVSAAEQRSENKPPTERNKMPQSSPFSFLTNSTTQALLSTASAATVGQGFMSQALGLAPSAPQLMGESLRKLSIGNTLTDAFSAGEREESTDAAPPEATADQEVQRPPQRAQPQRSPGRQLRIGGRNITNVNQLPTRGHVQAALSELERMGVRDPALLNALLRRMDSLPR